MPAAEIEEEGDPLVASFRAELGKRPLTQIGRSIPTTERSRAARAEDGERRLVQPGETVGTAYLAPELERTLDVRKRLGECISTAS